MRDMRHWLRALALLLAFGMIAASCGSSDGDSADGEGETETESEAEGAGSVDSDDAEAAVAEASDEEADVTSDSEATTFEELDAEWAAARQVIVDELTEKIEAGEYGIDDANILNGPGGFSIDLNECPEDWTETEGIGDTIKIGHPGPQSGNLAAYGNMGIGWETYLEYVNDNGGIGGVPVELLRRDDEYQSTKTIELVDELLQSDKPFAFHTLGSPNTLAVYDKINERCIPQMFVATGHPAWGDPIVHPWTTGSQMGYFTESILWGAWIKENMADRLPVKVAGLVMDNDFGLAYVGGMEEYAENNPDVIGEFLPITFDPAAATLTNEMTSLTAAEPDIAIGMMAGNPCLLMVEEAARNGLKESGAELFISSTCKDPNSFMIPAGDAADGWQIVGGGQKVNTDPQYAEDPYVIFANELLDNAGLDKTVGLYFTGMFYAWPTIEALKIANDLPGGLTRSNVALASRGIKLNHPHLVDGVAFEVNGNEDSYFIEGSEFSIFDAESETWIQEGGIVDLNGSSPNCTWDSAEGCT